MKLKTLIIVAALAVALGISAFAQRGGPRPGEFPATDAAGTAAPVDPLVAVQTALGLSAAQVESARALLTKQNTDIQPVAQEIRTKQEALRALQRSGTASATDLGTALSAVQASEAKLTAIHAKFLADFELLLTTDQKKVLADTRAAADKIPALARIGLVGGGPNFGFGGGRGPGGPGGPRGPR